MPAASSEGNGGMAILQAVQPNDDIPLLDYEPCSGASAHDIVSTPAIRRKPLPSHATLLPFQSPSNLQANSGRTQETDGNGRTRNGPNITDESEIDQEADENSPLKG
jgi:hypothetical protein